METFSLYGLGLLVSWAALLRMRSLRLRQFTLLIISYILYFSWGKWFVLILLTSSIANYGLGQYLKRRPSSGRLWVAVGFNLILLGAFKYLPGMVGAAPHAASYSAFQHIGLPLGISFWTFEALSFHFEIFRREEVDPSLLEFCLFMAFWPTVISGPICRLTELLPQLRSKDSPSWEDMAAGIPRIATGLIMLGVARILAAGLGPGQGVDAGFALSATKWSGIDVWFLAIGYGFRLFLDFAGYSSLVIGAARVCGFQLPENFSRPFLSTTPSEFWTRWHMSLSFWIRDFLFLPLASVNRSLWWRNFSLFISMVLFGLWHKGTILFLLWGALQGALLVLHRQWQKLRMTLGLNIPDSVSTALGWFFTFFGISAGWIFFRSESLHQAMTMAKAIVAPIGYLHRRMPPQFYVLVVCVALGYFAIVAVTSFLNRVEERGVFASSLQIMLRERWVWIAPGVAVLAVYAYLITEIQKTSLGSPFLYRLF